MIGLIGELINWQVALFCIEGEMTRVIVREIICDVSVADNEKLEEAEQGSGVAVAGVVFVIDARSRISSRISYLSPLSVSMNSSSSCRSV